MMEDNTESDITILILFPIFQQPKIILPPPPVRQTCSCTCRARAHARQTQHPLRPRLTQPQDQPISSHRVKRLEMVPVRQTCSRTCRARAQARQTQHLLRPRLTQPQDQPISSCRVKRLEMTPTVASRKELNYRKHVKKLRKH